MANGNKIKFDRNKLKGLIVAYDKALKAGKQREDVIIFDGEQYVVGYAKYLIEYLEMKLP